MTYYNEIFESKGIVRPQYAKIYSHWRTLSKTDRQNLHRHSIQHYAGDYAQDPLPRILTNNEVLFLQSGVEQRARAILAFLTDYSSNGNHWRRIMPEYLINSIIDRHHKTNFLREIAPDSISFPYGPDVIRDQHGDWRVVEDSAGIIGGLGDLIQNRKTLFKLIPEFRKSLPGISKPDSFLKDLADHYKFKASQNNGIPLMYLPDFELEPDQESRRLSRDFTKLGIEVTNYSNRNKKIVCDTNGIFLVTRGRKEKVGALILRTNPEHLENQNLLVMLNQVRKKRFKDFDAFREFNYSSFITHIKNNNLWTNFSPGVQFVNDKVFGLYVDSMIRYFLAEDPILKTIPAKLFAKRFSDGRWKIDQNILTNLRRNMEKFVIKEVDQDGGAGVWIGQKESLATLETLIKKIRQNPGKYIIQEFQHLSVLENRIVDLRIHAHVDHKRIIVSNTPWGRANWLKGDGKVNISTNGFTSPVVVLPN